MNRRKVLAIAILLCILITASTALGARQEEPEEQPGLAAQFMGSFTCMMTQCGWPAIILFILPAIAIYIWKKVFSWG